MNSYVLTFQEIDKTKLSLVGGKAANLAELCMIEGIKVPDGFCISTKAFKRIIAQTPMINSLLDELSVLIADKREKITRLSSEIRRTIEDTSIPSDIADEISGHLTSHGEKNAYAIRSSATAEDLPTVSFAGQQDTYLNVIGGKAILHHIRKCWASLFTDRAVIYRIQNEFDHRKVQMAVIVQKMIFSNVAGIMFTADPITSNRKILSIDASFGLGEALVSGIVNADNYKVRSGEIIDKKISNKKLAIYALKDGGTNELPLAPQDHDNQALADEEILRLENIGRKIEEYFSSPQDIEWCLHDNNFYIVQSRPITTLFPIPETNDQENHVYVSVGHQQMMTDAMKPLGISVWQLTAARPMYTAGGRLFVDVADILSSPATRANMLDVLGKSDPLIKDALTTIIERGDIIKSFSDDAKEEASGKSNQDPPPDFKTLKEYDPAIVSVLIRNSERSIEALKQNIETKSGTALIDFILEDRQELRKGLSDPESFGVIMTAMNASAWINEKMNEWLGEKNVADVLSQSVPNNVTSEMGLELLEVADVIRPYPQVVEYLQHVKDDNFLNELGMFNGGKEAHHAINNFLDRYGMRCAGEIDITRTRWSEKPVTIIPLILNNIKNLSRGESKRKFEQGKQQASQKEQDLLRRLSQLPDGDEKVKQTKRMIDLVRNLSGYREYPKYSIVSRYFVYKQALLKEAERLARASVIRDKKDIYYLTFEELGDVIRRNTIDQELVSKRKDEYRRFEKLTAPRVITSDGEIVNGQYKREHLPANAIVGLAVSSGVVEGRARVIPSIEHAELEEGDILVTSFTDPSWTPLFLSIKGLVTEVGGLMTHGAVIAREYGLPALVGVENATKRIHDGQTIRVNGTEGYVEILT
ncbi:MAG TPA: phosphoenolpyruvate synthase [Parafilimonas sp.]|nr:phosphoenolpyruvate synthase [Parafilimonas sp.]